MTAVRWSTLGNPVALKQLERAVLDGSPAHAYLFAGPPTVGKMHAAVEFAAALNCSAETPPCRACRNCDQILAGRHPDVEVVAPGGICDESDHRNHSESRDLRICQIRRLERVLSLAPYVGGRRVVIVDAADRLRVEAANAFLKTLEEPPAGTVLVLVTDREDQLPETVLSRCQRVAFGRVDRDTVVAALIERGADEPRAEAIAALANGRAGWALRALGDETLLAERAEMIEAAVRLARAGRGERFAWAAGAGAAERTAGFRDRYLREIEVWESWWRDILSVAAGESRGLVNADRMAALEEEGKLYTPGEVVRLLRALAETRQRLEENVDPQLALEVLTLDLPRPRPAPPVGRT